MPLRAIPAVFQNLHVSYGESLPANTYLAVASSGSFKWRNASPLPGTGRWHRCYRLCRAAQATQARVHCPGLRSGAPLRQVTARSIVAARLRSVLCPRRAGEQTNTASSQRRCQHVAKHLPVSIPKLRTHGNSNCGGIAAYKSGNSDYQESIFCWTRRCSGGRVSPVL